jgi:glucose-1-phosphatase
VRGLVPTGCLSNTNSIHWNAHFAKWALMTGFDHSFLSFEIGAVKPDQELFQFVADAIAAPPERTLFLDDNILNIDAALSFGFQAHRVKGVSEARRALIELGVLDS